MKPKMAEEIAAMAQARARFLQRVCPTCCAEPGEPCKDENDQDYGGVHLERQDSRQRKGPS